MTIPALLPFKHPPLRTSTPIAVGSDSISCGEIKHETPWYTEAPAPRIKVLT
jgi:hypothetical protein